MKATKILFINTEIIPYMPEGGRTAEIGRQLPQSVQESGHEIRTFMPRFGMINERRNQLHEVIRLSGMNLIINDTDHPLIIKVASIQSARMQVYFIDNDDYFTRRFLYADADGKEFADNVERCQFYARGVIETIRKLRWVPDVVHCQGWFSALAPLYIKKCFAEDPCFRNSKVVFSLYDDAFHTPFDSHFAKSVLREGITAADLAEVADHPVTHADLCKLAVKFSDGLIVMDPTADASVVDYARELGLPIMQHPEGKEKYVEDYNEFYEQVVG
jgi:starch synthase